MKPFLLFFFFIWLSQLAKGQDSTSVNSFVRSFERHFTIGYPRQQDSCFFISTLLRLRIDNYKVSSISFSDNAERWMTEELGHIGTKLNTKALEGSARENGNKDISIFFPFVIKKEGKVNGLCPVYHPPGPSIFRFNKKNINENSLFADSIEIIYYR